MKKDIILSGVGGQGILSIATIIGEAATQAGLYLKQAEVHGMSQRGGDVQSNLRLSTEPIFSDLIPKGKTDIIISMEPMEALRYLDCLAADGIVVTSSKPLVNITNYPEEKQIIAELEKLPRTVKADTDALAKDLNLPKGANMILLGAIVETLKPVKGETIIEALKHTISARKANLLDLNLKAVEAGRKFVAG